MEQQTYEIVLSDLAAWYRGAILHVAGSKDVLDVQVQRALSSASFVPESAAALAGLERIEATRVALSKNAQAALALESLFMSLGSLGLRGAA